MNKTIAIVGATGLVGSIIREEICKRKDVSEVRLLVRKSLEKKAHNEKEVVLDFTDLSALEVAIKGADILFCAIGTTNKKVNGDKDAYRKVDFDIPHQLGIAAKKTGVNVFLKVSAAGADKKSINFYAKLKGEVEEALMNLHLKSLYITRPSMLLGHRNEFRLGERIGQSLMQLFSIFIPRKWKAVKATSVAQAMISKAFSPEEGNHFITNEEILKY